MPATALLVTSDTALQSAVEKAVVSVNRCRLRVVPRIEDANRRLAVDRPAVLLMHLAADGDEAQAVGMIGRCREGRSGTAFIPICDRYETKQAVRLLGEGAADYLARPLDLPRLVFVIDMLTLNSRRGAGESAAQSKSTWQNVLERANEFSPERQSEPDDLPAPVTEPPREVSPPAPSTLSEARFDAEYRTVCEALENNGNNRSRAARQLGISRVTLYKKLHKFDLL